MKICSLSSGSKGNSIYIESDNTRILVDAGISGLQIRKRLESIEVRAEEIDGIVLTHAHADHIRGAGVFSRQNGTPIHGHPQTLDSASYLFKRKETIVPWKSAFQIKDITFTPFPVSHDSVPTVGYLISNGHQKVAVCTDLGVVTPVVTEHLIQAEILILESNHDPDMLINGPYPWDLKERIASRVGHLSNHDSGELLQTILNGKTKKIFLAHLSQENNTSELARQTVLSYVGNHLSDMISVFEQKTVSDVYVF